VTKVSPQEWHRRAYAALQAGDARAVQNHIVDSTKQHPINSAVWNTAGNLHLKMGDAAAARDCFGKAANLDLRNMDYAVNHAIALSALGQHHDAIAALVPFNGPGSKSAVYCSSRANAERGAGNSAQAAQWYDRALTLEPNRVKALHGRARVAIERGEPDAVQRVDRALSVNPGDADLWLAKAQALDVAGDTGGARQIAKQLVDQAPAWIEGLKFLAQLRLGAGETNFTSHFAKAIQRVPQDPAIPQAWSAVLAGLDFNEEAANVAANARKAFPQMEQFAFLDAIYSGSAGENDHAEAIFAALSVDTGERKLHEVRHRIRRKEYERAQSLLSAIFATQPWDISAWALQGVVWRLTGDDRAEWLCGQDGLVTLKPLINADEILPDAIPFLHGLHDGSPLPLGQSLRGGSQTRGHLFSRAEPILARLHQAIVDTLETYRQGLPKRDNAHPLLRHRDASWKLAGSWSVRLTGGGDYHTAHIHPLGIISSALYLELPGNESDDPMAGWLEVGRPATDLQTNLDPISTVEPKAGHLALFPSILYHGTRPFTGDRRMTVAFDVVTGKDAAQ